MTRKLTEAMKDLPKVTDAFFVVHVPFSVCPSVLF